MQKLRQRFMPDFKEDDSDLESSENDEANDYFGSAGSSARHTPSTTGSGTKVGGSRVGRNTSSDLKTPRARSPTTQPKVLPGSKRFRSSPPLSASSPSSVRHPSNSPAGLFRRRSQVNAGDLLTMTGSPAAYRASHRSNSAVFTPGRFTLGSVRGLPMLSSSSAQAPPSPSDSADGSRQKAEFDLKDGVMDCIAKSIGLIQPPISGGQSVEASPALLPTEPSYQSFSSSFSSLSLLQAQTSGGGMADDASSITGASTAWTRAGDGSAQLPLENEVEILFFKGGDVLVHAGERNAGTHTYRGLGIDLGLANNVYHRNILRHRRILGRLDPNRRIFELEG